MAPGIRTDIASKHKDILSGLEQSISFNDADGDEFSPPKAHLVTRRSTLRAQLELQGELQSPLAAPLVYDSRARAQPHVLR